MWEQIVASAEAHEELIRIAKEGRERGEAPAQILAEIENIAPPGIHPLRPPQTRNPDDFRKAAMERLGRQITSVRQHQGDEGVLDMIMRWSEAPVPRFRKLDSVR